MPSLRHRRKLVACTVLAVSAVLVAGCDTTAPVYHSDTGAATVDRLTSGMPVGKDPAAYAVQRTAGDMTVSAPAENGSGNQRSAIILDGTASTLNQVQCVEWSHESHPVNQEGVILRLRSIGDGAYSAISVTKSVWAYATWMFNVHEWNGVGAEPNLSGFTQIGQFDMSSVVGGALGPDGGQTAPWNLCAAALGNVLIVKVWTGTGPEPAWDDAAHTRQMTLPASLTQPGLNGVYAGHLAASDSIHYNKVWPLP